ncbi:MAG TPA: putative glycoside hydrolase [Candidatus Nitrosopolaris sp.]|nr:putative glycoside hydrolase [Candidatus Nitrosopolaris sp.]
MMRRVLSAALVVWLLGAPAVGLASDVPFFVDANASFDQFIQNPTPDQQAWMRAHYWRMLTYSPYFDSRLAWFPAAWVYKDLYAIYVGSNEATTHPEWVLHDAAGNLLYIPFGCRNGTCPQYAADVGNPDFRAQWIAEASTTMAAGYRGLYLDDVNLTLARVSDGSGTPVVPLDPRTGQPMREADWRSYLADFTVQIRHAFSTSEIVHNALWDIGDADPSVQQEMAAADWLALERGVNDRGIMGGGGVFGFDTFLGHIDFAHNIGRAVVFDAGARATAQRTYGLAVFFLIEGGTDGLGNEPGGTPNRWWTGYDVTLGAPTGFRYQWGALLRRDFGSGFVLVNPPGATPQRVTLNAPCRDLKGHSRTTVMLVPAGGAVLLCP